MSEEAAFLTAIRAAPDDLTTRGAYADWLEERGDPRTEFVRLAIALAETATRIRELAPSLAPEWIRSLARPWPSAPQVANRIAAIRGPSKFVPEPHLAIAVDGVPLDVTLGTQTEGLVSALLGWFHNDADSAIPWERILPGIGCTGYAPVLICPDDLDLSCSVVIAEVVAEPTVIRWDRLGFNDAPSRAVGSLVRWEPGWGPFCFDRAEYEACLAAFKVS
jgi:uncharacterized protein (TIGR02996 family)